MKPQTVQFGIVADVQYAEKPEAEGRFYNQSLKSLEKAADSFNSADLDFVIQLGDLIDGGDQAAEEMKRAAGVFGQIRTQKFHVLGNHDFVGISRPSVLKILQMEKSGPYYYFDRRGRRFVVLDTQDYSVHEGWGEDHEHFKTGRRMLDELRQQKAANAQEYNGAFGPEQIDWLDTVLSEADHNNMPVIVFGHLPLMPRGEKHTAWNADKIVLLFEKHPSVKAYLAGHNHAGGYTEQNGIHYVTLESMVNAADKEGAWGIVTVAEKTIEIRGFGDLTSRILPIYPD